MTTDQHFTDADRVALERYLDARGWSQTPINAPLLKQWVHQEASVQVPQDATLIDFGWLMERALARVARAEDRSPEKVLEALRDAALDVVRVRLGGADELPLKLGVGAIDALPRLLQAAAWFVLGPYARYGPHVSPHIKEYMDTVVLKQTEAGGFVLRIGSPLGQPDDLPTLSGILPVAPRGRRVTEQLARSVQAAAQAAQAAQAGRLDALEEMVPQGVSANLLDALAAFGEACEEGFAVELDWAKTLAPPDLPRSVAFERAWTPMMRSAAMSLRKQTPNRHYTTLTGKVIRFNGLRVRNDGENHLGKIDLWTPTNGELRHVEIELAAQNYQLAVSAHNDEALINVSGTLDQRPKKWCLLGAHGVERWREQDEDEPRGRG